MELTMQDLTKQYGEKTAVRQLNLTLTEGIYGLLGANGAGKSTLMRLICGLQKPTGGTIRLNGTQIQDLGERYRNLLGYLPQNFVCYPDFTAEQFLLYAAALKGLNDRLAGERTAELLQRVGLEGQKKDKVRTFSGGMRQRLGIAQALLNNPRILVLDEPTAGLDPRERVRFRDMLKMFSDDRIMLLSTHIISDVEQISDKVVLMKEGSIVYMGAMEQIRFRAGERSEGHPAGRSGEYKIPGTDLEELYLHYYEGEEQR